MSRRRYLSTVISVDRRLAQVSDSAALFYTWMIPHVEDTATTSSDPDELAAIVVPNRKNWTPAKVASVLRELAEMNLITTLNGTLYLPICSFYRYQSNIPEHKRRTYDIPANEDNQKKIPETAQNSTYPSPSPSPSKHMSTVPADVPVDNFAEFWKLYPKKVGKGKARESFVAAKKKAPVERIVAGLESQLSKFRQTEARFIPLPATWLNQERWEDEVEVKEAGREFVPFKPPTDEEIANIERLADFGIGREME